MFKVVFVIVTIIIVLGIVITFGMLFSPKLRSKFMGAQIKSMKYMIDDNKENLTDITSAMGNISVESRKRILEQNEDTLRELATKQAEINSAGLEEMAKAVKNGFRK